MSNKVRLDPLSQRHVANVLEWHDAAQKQLSALQMPIDNGDINRYSTNRLRVPTHAQPVARPMMISPPQSLLGVIDRCYVGPDAPAGEGFGLDGRSHHSSSDES